MVENEKSARKFLKRSGIENIPDKEFILFNEHSDIAKIARQIEEAYKHGDVAVLSEAGCPGVADPGADIVKMAHQNGVEVIPLVGPSSILLALMASGFNGQNFVFHGYLPIDKKARTRKIKEIERNAYRFDQSQIFIETPYRNDKLFEELLRVCSNSTWLSIACNLTLDDQRIHSKSILEWNRSKPDLRKKPAVFIIYK